MNNNRIRYYKNFKFCFFSRNGGVSKKNFRSLNCAFNSEDTKENVEKNRELARKKFSKSKRIVLMNQVHSNKVILVDEEERKILNVDGMVSKRKDLCLGILTADCAPIIILGQNYYGIIHAGWRGLVNDILLNAVNLFKDQGESEKDLHLFVGPHLKKNSFEVKGDFISLIQKKKINPELFTEKREGKIYFDFSKLIKQKIQDLNIKNFCISKIDTFKNNERFFSYRFYSKKGIINCGRQISLVCSK